MATHPKKRRDLSRDAMASKEDAIFVRNESLRMIIRKTFHDMGQKPHQADADLSAKLSEETFKIIEQTGVKGAVLRRRVQLYAAFALLTIREQSSDVAPEIAAEFLALVLGSELTLAFTKQNFKALDPIHTSMKYLLVRPEWAAVHGGHVAMSCMSLLSRYDVSFLNWRMPPQSGTSWLR